MPTPWTLAYQELYARHQSSPLPLDQNPAFLEEYQALVLQYFPPKPSRLLPSVFVAFYHPPTGTRRYFRLAPARVPRLLARARAHRPPCRLRPDSPIFFCVSLLHFIP